MTEGDESRLITNESLQIHIVEMIGTRCRFSISVLIKIFSSFNFQDENHLYSIENVGILICSGKLQSRQMEGQSNSFVPTIFFRTYQE